MDNLTHALVGAAISKAGAERTTPLATATLVLAANAPDIDVLAYTRGEYFALAFRRGITHGVPALLVLPFVVAGVILAWDRWVRRARAPDAPPARAGPILLWSAVGLLTHPTLDWMNTYGMRWGLPFDGSWTYGDALFIIDPWIWLVLGGSVFLASRPGRGGLFGWLVLAGLTSTIVLATGLGPAVVATWVTALVVIGATRALGRPVAAHGRTRLVRTAGLATIVYIAAMVVADAAARGQVLRAAETAGLDVTAVMVAPRAGHPLSADVEVRTADAFVPGRHRWLGGERVRLDIGRAVPLLEAPDSLDRERTRAIVDAASGHAPASHWLVWSRYPYAVVFEEADGWLVHFRDARYDGRPGAGGLAGVVARLGPDLAPRPPDRP